MTFRLKLCTLFFLFCVFLQIGIIAEEYTVRITGIENEKTRSLLEANSQLVQLADKPPKTKMALKRRADGDIAGLLQVMQSEAYYGAEVTVEIDYNTTPITVTLAVETGEKFKLESFLVETEDEENESTLYSISLKDLDICIGSTAYPKSIIRATDQLLGKLNLLGYPLATIKEQSVVANLEERTVNVTLTVDTGPIAYFGKTMIEGCTSVNKRFICRKVEWGTGDLYNPCKVNKTVEALEAANLFSSINITHADYVEPDGSLPMTIEVSEGKHRSIAAGVSFTSERGLGDRSSNSSDIGGLIEWEHRNIRGLGEKLSLSLNVWSLTRRGRLLYQKPDFIKKNQDYLFIVNYEYDKTLGFTEESWQLSSLLERRISCNTRISYGGVYKWLDTRDSDNDGTFNLFKTPFNLYWSNTNSLLDPTYGITCSLKTEPSIQVTSPQFYYWTNRFIGTAYYPLRKDHSISLAAKLIVGTILGTSRHQIPPSERFYAGSENTLRGYRYLSVSPFDDPEKPDKPTGGRSMLIYSLETRIRTGKNLGWVVFTDIGNVYNDRIPQFNSKKLVSVGGGVRYFTPIGPLRLDVAFPLDRRKRPKDPGSTKKHYIDGVFQVYVSIGQAF